MVGLHEFPGLLIEVSLAVGEAYRAGIIQSGVAVKPMTVNK